MGEIKEFSRETRETEEQSSVDSGILKSDNYKDQRVQVEKFLKGEIPRAPDFHREAQAQGMARHAKIELPEEASNLYVFMRGLNTSISDQRMLDEVLRLTNNEKRSDFRKAYPNIFQKSEEEGKDQRLKAA
ncbi:MAG: hypothetical protein ABI643_03140 [Candidatus Doudnabacteria bacterium]